MLPTQFNGETLAAFKRSLRAVWPEVGSSHADEAIAALCGYRTYASLLYALSQEPEQLVFEPYPDQLMARLGELGYKLRPSDFDRVLKTYQSEFLAALHKRIARMADNPANDNTLPPD